MSLQKVWFGGGPRGGRPQPPLGADALGPAATFLTATGSDHRPVNWRTGPSPWWASEGVDAAREALLPAQYRCLTECQWAEADDARHRRRCHRLHRALPSQGGPDGSHRRGSDGEAPSASSRRPWAASTGGPSARPRRASAEVLRRGRAERPQVGGTLVRREGAHSPWCKAGRAPFEPRHRAGRLELLKPSRKNAESNRRWLERLVDRAQGVVCPAACTMGTLLPAHDLHGGRNPDDTFSSWAPSPSSRWDQHFDGHARGSQL